MNDDFGIGKSGISSLGLEQRKKSKEKRDRKSDTKRVDKGWNSKRNGEQENHNENAANQRCHTHTVRNLGAKKTRDTRRNMISKQGKYSFVQSCPKTTHQEI